MSMMEQFLEQLERKQNMDSSLRLRDCNMQSTVLKTPIDERILSVLSSDWGKCTSQIARDAGICKSTATVHLWKLWGLGEVRNFESGRQLHWKIQGND